MSNQRIRIVAALAIVIVAMLSQVVLLALRVPTGREFADLALVAAAFLFGTTTNGSNKPLG